MIPVTGGHLQPITAGLFFTCAVNAEGGVECWGQNDLGQLGNGTNEDSNTPVIVIGPEGEGKLSSPVKADGPQGVVDLSAGLNHTCALESNGDVWCWGLNDEGQLGNGTNEDSNVSVQVPISGAIDITSGPDYSCAVLSSGEVKCWGANDKGQLNDGTRNSSNLPVTSLIYGVRDISAGQGMLCGLDPAGNVKCWSGGEEVDTSKLEGPMTFVIVSRFSNRVVALNADGDPVLWQAGGSGKLVKGASGGIYTDSGANDTCVIVTGGGTKCWGQNKFGGLGNGKKGPSDTPVDVETLSSTYAIAVGQEHVCSMSGGEVMCWGYNSNGQLGNGSNEDSNVPVPVQGW